MLSDQQQVVYEWLGKKLNLPVFAEVYRGAVIFLAQPPSGHITFVAHAGRDLMNRLAPTVAGIESGRVQYQQRLDELVHDWNNEWSYEPIQAVPNSDGGHMIPYGVCRKVHDLIAEHKEGRIRSSDSDGLFFTTFLDYPDCARIPANFLADWKAAKKWFLRYAHLRTQAYGANAAGEAAKYFSFLHDFLYVAASSEYQRIKEIDEILEETNE